MKLSRRNADDGSWEAFTEEDWFRVCVGSTWFDVQERGGGIFIHTSGQIAVHPVASNGVVLLDRD